MKIKAIIAIIILSSTATFVTVRYYGELRAQEIYRLEEIKREREKAMEIQNRQFQPSTNAGRNR